jgi:chromosome segregation ATPase
MGNNFSFHKNFNKSVYELIFNKFHLNPNDLKNKLIDLLQKLEKYHSKNLIQNIYQDSKTYQSKIKSYFDVNRLHQKITINNNEILIQEFPLYYTNIFILYLIESNYIIVKEGESLNVYDKNFINEYKQRQVINESIPILQIKKVDLLEEHIDFSITIFESLHLVNLYGELQVLNHTLSSYWEDYNQIVDKEQENAVQLKQKIDELTNEIKMKEMILKSNEKKISLLEKQYNEMLNKNIINEMELLKKNIYKLEEIHSQIQSKDDIEQIKTEKEHYDTILLKINENYSNLKTISIDLSNILNNKKESIAFIKSELFKYFKFFKILQNDINELRQTVSKSISYYNDILTRQNLIKTKMDTLIKEKEAYQLKILDYEKTFHNHNITLLKKDVEKLDLLFELLMEKFKNGQIKIIDVEQKIVMYTQLLDKYILFFKKMVQLKNQQLKKLSKKQPSLKTNSQYIEKTQQIQSLHKYIHEKLQSKKKYMTQELTKKMKQTENETNSYHDTIVLKLMNEIKELKINNKALNEKLDLLKNINDSYKKNLLKQKEVMDKYHQLQSEKENYLSKTNKSIQSFQTRKNILKKQELNNLIEEKKLIMDFYNRLLSELKQSIDSFKLKCEEQEKHISNELFTIQNKINSLSNVPIPSKTMESKLISEMKETTKTVETIVTKQSHITHITSPVKNILPSHYSPITTSVIRKDQPQIDISLLKDLESKVSQRAVPKVSISVSQSITPQITQHVDTKQESKSMDALSLHMQELRNKILNQNMSPSSFGKQFQNILNQTE